MAQSEKKLKVNIGSKSNVNIKWNVHLLEYTDDAEQNIKASFAKKYGISPSKITVEPTFIRNTKEGKTEKLTDDLIGDINNPEFQRDLFKLYLKESQYEGYDFDKIIELDNLINAELNFEVYDRKRRYSLKWIRWSNFMSYGENNFFDFTSLNGLVLLTSNPANQGGKTTFSIDLLRYLLYGKTDSRGEWKKDVAFNRYLPDAKEVTVEGCIEIDGEEYVIKRVLTRPQKSNKPIEKCTIDNKVFFYKVANGNYVNMYDNGEDSGEDSITATNKLIRSYIGEDYDFSLMISVDDANLKSLITQTDGERGKLVKRWVGLKPLRDKLEKARQVHNEIAAKLLKNTNNKADLENSIEEYAKDKAQRIDDNASIEKRLETIRKNIEKYTKEKESLLSSMTGIDENLTKTDIKTVENTIKTITEEGLLKAQELKDNQKKLEEYKSVTFDESEYKKCEAEYIEANNTLVALRNELKSANEAIKNLETSQYCPTCHTKLKDNTALVTEKKKEVEVIVKKGKTAKESFDVVDKKKKELEEKRRLSTEKTKTELKIIALDATLKSKREELKEAKKLRDSINANKTAIEKNNDLQAKANVIKETIATEQNSMNAAIELKTTNNVMIKRDDEESEKCRKLIALLEKEEKEEANWRIYLEMLDDKRGVSKMILQKVLPFINNELKHLLNDVCDFELHVTIDEKDNVSFYIVRDNIMTNLSTGSGFEQTVASLALRSVLSKISTFTKPSFVVFDEILGSVADENYDQVKLLYDKIVKDYAFVLQITHIKQLFEWHDHIIQITKKNNISRIEVV